jgi:hypothetical protein
MLNDNRLEQRAVYSRMNFLRQVQKYLVTSIKITIFSLALAISLLWRAMCLLIVPELNLLNKIKSVDCSITLSLLQICCSRSQNNGNTL